MTDEPTLFDELAFPGITLRNRALALATHSAKPLNMVSEDIAGIKEHACGVEILTEYYVSILKGERIRP